MRYGKWGASFSPEETAEAGRIARRLGGYEEMLRLERDLARYQRSGTKVRMVLDADGRRQLEPAETAAAARPETETRRLPAPTPPAPSGKLPALLRRLLLR